MKIFKVYIKSSKYYTSAKNFKNFLKKTGTKFIYFLIPLSFSLIAAIAEGIGTALLLPLVKGILQMDFSFLRETAPLRIIMTHFGDLIYYPNTFVFVVLVTTIFTTLLISIIMKYFSGIAVSYQLRKFSDRLRKFLFERYLSFGKQFFDRNNSGYLQNILIHFTNYITQEIRNLHEAFNCFFSLIIYFVIMWVISPKLALITILLLPISNYSLKWLIHKIKDSSKFYTNSFRKINESIFNTLSCTPLVKIYCTEAQEKEKFYYMSHDLRNLEFSLDKKSLLVVPIQEIIVLMSVMLLLSIMSFMVIKEKAGEISNFLIFFYLLRKSTSSFNFLNIVKIVFANISGPMHEIDKIFNDKDKFFVFEGREEFGGLKNTIEFKNLSFSYTGRGEVLKNITCLIEKGKKTALVGPSGAGKTTFINLILRFYDCPESSIFIDGIDIRKFTLKSLRKHMALVSQDTLLFNDTLRQNIIYGLDRQVEEKELIDVVEKAMLYDYVKKLPSGFETYIGDRGVKLSGGEKQRVTIARALLKGSEILMLDEATSSLDSATEKLIQEAVDNAVKNRTAIIIAHRLSTIKNADKIIVIESGRLVEEGSLNSLLEKKGKFYQYWEAQKFY